MQKRIVFVLLLVLALAAVSVNLTAAQSARSYIIVAHGNSLPGNLDALVQAAGGVVTSRMPQIGLAVAESANPNFARSVPGVQAVLPDAVVQWLDPSNVGGQAYDGTVSAALDYRPLQWSLNVVNAPEAWAAGQRGVGVRVAVLDSGIDRENIDLDGNLNTALSTSFVPGQAYYVSPGFYFNHGTHVAGIIGAEDNGVGTVGIAPSVELVAVKVLSEYTGSGAFSWVINGIYYAALIDADIINMSLGAVLPQNGFCDAEGCVRASEINGLKNALSRATSFAYQQGTTVIVAAGNNGVDRDHDAALLVLPADSSHVISISALGPVGFGRATMTAGFDTLAYYSNYGQSRIHFGAPGGNYEKPFAQRDQVTTCTKNGVTELCWRFDGVISTISEGWGWAQGTSMAAPTASGVAAIIIGANGGSLNPAQVEAALRARAEDLGKPGNDDWYGAGRVSTGY